MSVSPQERAFVEQARVGHLATTDDVGQPHVVPFCFAFANEQIVSAIDEKPQNTSPLQLRRVRNVQENPAVSVIVDRYVEDWDRLGWVRIDGRCEVCNPNETTHDGAIAALLEKYDQYEDHRLEERPLLAIEPRSVSSWGTLSWD